MIIQKVEMYDTDIGFLFQRMKDDTIFVSDWENGIEELNIGEAAAMEVAEDNKLYDKYIYSRDLGELKTIICDYVKRNSISCIKEENIMISSNASISGLLAAIHCKKNLKKKNVLIIGPIYFTYLHLFMDFGIEIYNLKLDIFKNEALNIEKLGDLILKYDIGSVLIINPLYRTGVAFEPKEMDAICKKSYELGCFTIIDEAYGNFLWKGEEDYCCNIPMINIVLKYDNVILFDSLAKRVFANGMKSSIIYGDKKIISFLEKETVIYTGSLSYIQVSFLKYLFTTGEKKVKAIMSKSKEIVKENCRFYQGLTEKWDDMKITTVNSGYFALIGIPTRKFAHMDEENIAIELIEKYGLMIVPYSRYHYWDKDYLYFSINLLMDRKKIEKALTVCGENFC